MRTSLRMTALALVALEGRADELAPVPIDDLGSQLSPAYASLRRDYGRVVRQRNALLKDEPGSRELAVWDDQAAALGARLLTHRLRLLSRVMAQAAVHYASMAGGEGLSWSYEDRCGLVADGTEVVSAKPDGTVLRRVRYTYQKWP